MLIRIFNKVYQFILGNKVLRFGLYFILLLYPFCFYFLLKNRGVNFGDITNLIIPIYVIVFIDIIYRLKLIRNSISENIIYISKIYFIIELLLVIIKPANIYDKYIVDEFILSYDYNQSNYYHLKKPFEKYQLKSDEFNFNRKANSIGIPEKEILKNKPKNITRILCLGDSFTEGDGADKDSSYVTFLNRSLQQKFQKNSNSKVTEIFVKRDQQMTKFTYPEDVYDTVGWKFLLQNLHPRYFHRPYQYLQDHRLES